MARDRRALDKADTDLGGSTEGILSRYLSLYRRFVALMEVIPSLRSAHLRTHGGVELRWVHAWIDPLHVVVARNSSAIIYTDASPLTFFALPLCGRMVHTYDDRRVVTVAGRDLLISRPDPVRIETSEHFECMYVIVDTVVLRRWIGDSERADLQNAMLGGSFSLDDAGVGDFANFLKALETDYRRTGAWGDVLRKRRIADEFRQLYLRGPVAAVARKIQRPLDPLHHTAGVAAQFLRDNLDRKVALGEIEQRCGVSGRTIQTAFKKYFGYSPWTYLKICRLEQARRQLANRDENLSVAEIALACGFDHLGQFAAEYRRYFGETPKRTSVFSRSIWNHLHATFQAPRTLVSLIEIKRRFDGFFS